MRLADDVELRRALEQPFREVAKAGLVVGCEKATWPSIILPAARPPALYGDATSSLRNLYARDAFLDGFLTGRFLASKAWRSAFGPAGRTRLAPHGRRSWPVRHGIRQRRVVDLLRARPRRGSRAWIDAARVHPGGRAVRARGEDVCGGGGDVAGGGRFFLVRPPRLQRGRVVLRRLGADPRLHHHDR